MVVPQSPDDSDALDDLSGRHPSHPLPQQSDDIPAPLCVSSAPVLDSLKTFSWTSCPGFSKIVS